MAKKLSSAYWRKRQHEREAKALSDIKEVEAEYKRALEVARRNISKEISRLGHSFMRENELTYAEALKKLSGAEHRSWRMEVSQYMKKYKKLLKKEPVEAQKLWIELETLSMRSRISHLDAIHAQINMELMAMGQEVATSGRDALHGIYGSAFKGVAMDLGVKTGFSADMVKAVIDRPWSGLNYSQRIWKNTDRLAAVLKQEVVTSLIQGVNLKKMESRLRKKVVGASKTDVERLLRTEVNYTMNQATLDGYKEAQVEMYIFDATIDGRTSQICAGLNGERFKLEKAVVGVNYPPMHPRCRSTTEPILEEKKAKKKKAVIEKPEEPKPKAAEKKKEEKPKEKPVKKKIEKPKEKQEKTLKKQKKEGIIKVDESKFRECKDLAEFKKLADASWNNCTEAERKALSAGWFQKGNSMHLNKALRGEKWAEIEKAPWFSHTHEMLQTAIPRTKLPRPYKLVRYDDPGMLEGTFGVSLNDVEKIKGVEYVEKQYKSTSFLGSANLMDHRLVQVEILAPEGTPYVANGNEDESEAVLNIGTKFKVIDARKEERNGKLKAFIKMIIVKE